MTGSNVVSSISNKNGILKRRGFEFALALVVAFATFCYLWRFDFFQVGAYLDDGEYIDLARAIVNGDPYGVVTAPSTMESSRYPIGWPLILSVIYGLTSGNHQALKLTSLSFTLLVIVATAYGWRQLGFSSRWIGLAAATLFAFSPLVVGQSRVVMSEPAYTFFSLFALILTANTAGTGRLSRTQYVFSGLLCIMALLTRTIGFTLVIACVTYLVIRRAWKPIMLSLAGAGAGIALILVFTSIQATNILDINEYLTQLDDRPNPQSVSEASGVHVAFMDGVNEYAKDHIRSVMIPLGGSRETNTRLERLHLGLLPGLASLFVISLISIGLLLSIQISRLSATHLYIVTFMVITFAWPYRGDRFLYPLLPLFWGFFLMGSLYVVVLIWGRFELGRYYWFHKERALRGVGLTMFGLLLTLQISRSLALPTGIDHVRDLRIGATWVRDNAEADAIVFAAYPSSISLYTDRTVYALPATIENLVANVACHAYVLIGPNIEWHTDGSLQLSQTSDALNKAMERDKPLFNLVFEDTVALVYVYKVAAACQD